MRKILLENFFQQEDTSKMGHMNHKTCEFFGHFLAHEFSIVQFVSFRLFSNQRAAIRKVKTPDP